MIDFVVLQDGRCEWEEKSVQVVGCRSAAIRGTDRKVDLQSGQTHPALREVDRSEWHVPCKWWIISVNKQTKQASVSENNLWICAAGQSEAALQTRDAVRGDDERRRAGVHSGRHPDEERLGVFSPLPGVQQLPQPAAVWAAGQLRPLSVHAAVRPAGEAWAEGRVSQNTDYFCSFNFDMGIHSMLRDRTESWCSLSDSSQNWCWRLPL